MKPTPTRAEFDALARLIAQELGEGWTYTPSTNTLPSGSIQRNNHRIYLSHDGLRVSANWGRQPEHLELRKYGDFHVSTITMSPTKTPDQIATDINRRLIPNIDAAVSHFEALKQKHQARGKSMDAVMGAYRQAAAGTNAFTFADPCTDALGASLIHACNYRAGTSNFLDCQMSDDCVRVEGYLPHHLGQLLFSLLAANANGQSRIINQISTTLNEGRTFHELRRQAADNAFDSFDFEGAEIVGVNGWETTDPGTDWERTFFVRNDAGGASVRHRFYVIFDGVNSTQVADAGTDW